MDSNYNLDVLMRIFEFQNSNDIYILHFVTAWHHPCGFSHFDHRCL